MKDIKEQILIEGDILINLFTKGELKTIDIAESFDRIDEIFENCKVSGDNNIEEEILVERDMLCQLLYDGYLKVIDIIESFHRITEILFKCKSEIEDNEEFSCK